MDPIFESSFHRLSKPELIDFGQKTINKIKELETLIEVISKGKHQWEATFDAIADPLMIVSHDFKIRRANLAVAHTAGVPITQVTGRHCYEIFAGRKKTCDGCPLLVSIGEGKGVDEKLGHPIHNQDFHVYAYPIVEANGESDSAVVYYRNVTEEIRLRQELVQQEKMAAIGMLAGGVAHEINNPLGGILAFTQILLSEVPSKSKIHEDLKEIEKAAMRSKSIVENLLYFSRVSKLHGKEPVDLAGVVEKAVSLVSLKIRHRDIRIKKNFRKVSPVYGDFNQLVHVFLNLLQNAVEAVKNNGSIEISIYAIPSQQEVGVKVRDDGQGIDVSQLSKIFNPFFTTKNKGQHPGLGLSVSYQIVKDHGGEVKVESDRGRGTQFVVRMPKYRPKKSLKD